MSGAEGWKSERTEHWLTAAWSEGLCRALALKIPGDSGLMLESKDPVPASWVEWPRAVWAYFPCEAAEPAGLYIGCSRSAFDRLGLLASGGDQKTSAQAYREAISDACADAATAAQERGAGEVVFTGSVDVDGPTDPSLGVELWFEADGVRGSIAVVPDAGFLRLLAGQESETPASVEAERPAPGTGDAPKGNLEMLLDLDMEIAVSFGRTEMVLADVLKLSVGSIVELDCQASDPVEVLVNDAVIARGEVVVVDGNYGVRITDVSSRRERIRSIL